MNCPVPNQNHTDRSVRLGIGLLTLILGYAVFTGIVQQVAFVISALAFYTALTGFCPLYHLLGISTNRQTK